MRTHALVENGRFPHNSITQPDGLVDNHGRQITYLRLAITDRCNLRCRYCRPESGVPFIPHDEILRFEELERFVHIFTSLGINKIRVTGGEPFSRRGCVDFLARLKAMPGVESLYITTNGVKTARFLDELVDLGISGINLSLDTLNPKRFWQITRRDYLDSVLETLSGALQRKIPLKVNSVVLPDTTDEEIRALTTIAEQHPVTLRFIETMPFSGEKRIKKLTNGNLLRRLKSIFPQMEEEQSVLPTTAKTFIHPGFQGKLGIINGHSRLFCASCNKVRITPAGMLKTCLYDNGALNLKDWARGNASDQAIRASILDCIHKRFANGHEAEKDSQHTTEPSMGMIGG
jgi:cyclic pyranopterin phosphate synthase